MPRPLTLLLALCLSTTVYAQSNVEDLRDIQSARAYGMGGAYRALGLGTEAVVGNPAAIALWKMYRMELHGSWDTAGKDAFGGVSLMDAKTSDLAAGLDYHILSLRSGEGRTTGHYSTLAFALPLTPGILIGTSVHYLKLSGPRQANATTVDAGLMLRLSDGFTTGFSAHNLIDTQNAELTRYYSLHAGYLAGLFTVGADVRADFESRDKTVFTYSAGLEYILGQAFPLRLGYTYDGFQEASQLGFGLGFMTETGGGIDLGYRHDLGGERGRLLALTIKLQVG
jgi:opacity protein-like surface antigen